MVGINAVLNILNLVVNLRTDVINNKMFPSFSHTVGVRPMWFYKKRVIISLYRINKLVFIIETHCFL